MENINLENLTEFQLLELRAKINGELELYQNRSKVQVFTVFQDFGETAYFIQESNAIQHLRDLIESGDLFEDKVVIEKKYYTESEAKAWCRDLNY